ncbi:dicarboxylate/amino acid:cation symporter [Qipengyuania sediminis]|uniref:dicarboxylate/amino acid:cation symporter n=1 Tax=Qipengyuania sediminis TaxID=1532023 RepID=UPI00105A8EE2|nr:cation:dicarboxylase symporter family transporter [Qipengyuania sediminis]
MGQRGWWITGALVLGLVAGAVVGPTDAGERAAPLILPIGQLWLQALTMTVVPLVFSLLVAGMARAVQAASGGAFAARAMALFAIGLLAATGLAALLTPALLEIAPVPAAAAGLQPVGSIPEASPDAPAWYMTIIPTNPIGSAAEGAMVPLVVFAILFGLAMGRIEGALRESLETVFRAIIETMLVIVGWVLALAPLGVAALAFGVGTRLGASAASVLAHYMAIVIAICLAVTLLAVAATWAFGRLSPAAFLRAAFPAQTIAVSTQSSLASLPAMIEAAGPLGVDRDRAGIVLPLAVSVFKAASAGANVAVAVYLAQLHGVAVTPAGLAVGAVVAAAVSVGAVGLPAQVNFFAIIAPVCIAMGVPVELLPVLLAIESVPDIFRTLGNVTADLAVTRIAGREAAAGQA